ncbi:hypothetical protein NUU61_003829 [Penicillium alfredii]|uniref:F-box domain-containing protein n=1 Tax=Penicillium alfredii TaxID=1506179 RepID=A0A9W9FK20_9EURO|nr:uncharacterized protein NUU61_003829 [Penicillium alfredii]KAJ5101607.1 hypothetical protein NUU61_003829 [Penicillium alfredii]
MAAATLNGVDKLSPDLGMSSDEEDFVSSQSTASGDIDQSAKQHLSTALEKMQHQNVTWTFPPETRASSDTPPASKMAKKPLELLDLPLDVLKDIIKEVTHTNDLTSLALTCSAIHSLTIPHMYSRFDIVWPESLTPTPEDYTGVDALSHGLSTLVMGEDVFGQLPLLGSSRSASACSHCGCDDRGHRPASTSQEVEPRVSLRRGNNYAQYTRTFSIGNGPLGWVQEYSVNKEVGKMLGTLVALAVARMVNLEAFIWDMPTGVVREIWLALASLANRPGHECRLERVWVRWHDNSEHTWRTSTMMISRLLHNYKHVEHPSLSVLPPLKSVAVLDIDEPAYVEELAVLVERSHQRLTELRIGISAKAYMAPWLICGKDSDTSSTWPRMSGVLGILSPRNPVQQDDATTVASMAELSMASEGWGSGPASASASASSAEQNLQTSAISVNGQVTSPQNVSSSNAIHGSNSSPLAASASPGTSARSSAKVPHPGDKVFNLQLLELERVPLFMPSLLPAIDWTRLATLTIMRCEDHEKLWGALRRKYAPPELPPKRSQNGDHDRPSLRSDDFALKIKNLRTDTVSPHFMLFIKEALAPNTLECVSLHEAPSYDSTVQVDAIYRHILRKHRLSLRNILVDATDRTIAHDSMNTQWHKWIFNHEMISFVTSGRMPHLKELAMSMHYRDWHYFLQRLPNMPQVRALYLPHIRHSVHRDLKELALQILDIVSIRPDLKVAYIGLENKCYQILEATRNDQDSEFDDNNPTDPFAPTDEEDPWDNGNFQPNTLEEEEEDIPDAQLVDDLANDDSDDSDSEPEALGASRIQFRLQEILFYDDKISIFKARHGVL